MPFFCFFSNFERQALSLSSTLVTQGKTDADRDADTSDLIQSQLSLACHLAGGEPFLQGCIYAKYLLVMVTPAIKCIQHVAVACFVNSNTTQTSQHHVVFVL